MQITTLITSCGGEIIPGIIDCLRSEPDYDFEIIGIDMDDDAIGQRFVDSFYTVPGGLDDEYIPRMREIVEHEDVDIIVPISDQETRSLSKHKDVFHAVGAEVLTPDGEAVEISSDKGSMLEYLDNNGVKVPEYRIPNSFEELDEAVFELGYPKENVVLKPRRQRAARGFWMLSDERSTQDLVMNEKCLQTLPYNSLRELVEGKPELPDLVVMEYLRGPDFNVDCLSIDTSSVYQIPIQRVKPAAGPVQVGETVHDSRVQDMAKDICDTFEFEYNTNVELAYPTTCRERDPLVYEINPRVSGPIATHKAAGINLLLYGILTALGEGVPVDEKFDEIRVNRCWQEIYTTGGE
ncbi:ATP-grasp domain-containing protein [Natronomonas gomsonensis]|uniref:ATP-grasp domain-containing protein n=1 Tax=Natronomonas gomsonensis TaxID=1046043 RepID=UPI00227A070B|nr:ATP-grasp domain-containing protein [Natronomonas gomsonensis]MCY4732128.1 ATP-grasp domain-containing protein [Natronomonas gomsonensis]